jgi:hypothetical protein
MIQLESRLDCQIVILVQRGFSEPMKMLFQIMEGDVVIPVSENGKVHFSFIAREKAIMDHENGNKIMIMLKQLNCETKNGIIHLDLGEDTIPDLKFISSLLEMNTIVMAPCIIRSESIECPFYFHISELQEISRIIMQSEEYYEGIKDQDMPMIKFLGQIDNPNQEIIERYRHNQIFFIKVMEKLDKNHPVKLLAESVFGKFKTIYGEIQSYCTSPEKSWVMFPDNILKSEYPGLKLIRELPEPVYGLRSDIVLVDPVFSAMFRVNFFWYRALIKLDDTGLEITAVVDRDNIKPLLEVIHEVAASNSMYKPVIQDIIPAA